MNTIMIIPENEENGLHTLEFRYPDGGLVASHSGLTKQECVDMVCEALTGSVTGLWVKKGGK